MKTYSPFFQTLWDEPNPRGHSNGPYSVLRAVVFCDKEGKPYCRGINFDFCIKWDQDRDERVLGVIEACYRQSILSSLVCFAESEGVLTGVLVPGLSSNRIALVRNCLETIGRTEVESDLWTVYVEDVGFMDPDISIRLRNTWALGGSCSRC